MNDNPLNEYITGVLAPVLDISARRTAAEIESEAELPVEDTQSYEEEMEDVDIHVPPMLHPALNPKNRPSTIGLSFVVEAAGKPVIDVCLTWARYREIENREIKKKSWQREPRKAVFSVNLLSSETYWIDNQGRLVTDQSDAEISFHVIVRPLEGNRYLVNLFLVNRLKPPAEGEPLKAEHCIFQPQIRVSCGEGTRLVPGIRRKPADWEEQKLEFLYRHRPVLARGHLCSAVWRDVDPENHPDYEPDFKECLNEPPFTWPDGELLPADQRRRFSPPDVRTEFVPIYSIPFPDLSWPANYGESPELRAHVLAEEMWEPEKMRRALSPICTGYEKWIEDLEKQLTNLPDNEREVARSLIAECRQVLERIRSGIDLLCRDDDARLSFCFANKAMDVQHRWTKKTGLTWHPFQLAYILLVLESIANPESVNRDVCDLLWVPTGAGKTEAYLAIVAFTIAYRRRMALKGRYGEPTGAGVSVITRYTLRLLTIQQFRRALAVITACEYLRVLNLGSGGPVGWRPPGCTLRDDFLWGSTPFMIGLWVGGGVTPNKLSDTWGGDRRVYGALSILKGEAGWGQGEPAQILKCPACETILSIPEMGLRLGRHEIHLVVSVDGRHGQGIQEMVREINGKEIGNIIVEKAEIHPHSSQGFYTLSLEITSKDVISSRDVDELWNSIRNIIHAELVPARASRPGYFIRYYIKKGGGRKEYDFEIFCPNPRCPLHRPWCGGTPTGWTHGRARGPGPQPDGNKIPRFPDGNRLIDVQEPFRYNDDPNLCDRIPIPALTVDEQLYSRLPAVVVATVDKFARPPFDPEAAALFGNVEFHDCVRGYYRQLSDRSPHTGSRKVEALRGPDLIIQDELHLIEGPLGSLVGIYETAVDFLCREGGNHITKYIASTATIRGAEGHVRALFLRRLQLFPPHGLTSDDRFFTRDREIHAIVDRPAGRLYVGICAPGRGPHTPIVRIFARLLQTAYELSRNHSNQDVDAFWTLTGYFNAVRELAGTRALYRQDIPQRINAIAAAPRNLSDERALELSSRTSSTNLPAILEMLNTSYPDAPDALFTTSMFGTGVDIPRIGLMVVVGQPKTTSAYIQSTGRVGRRRGALVVTFYRASRPRDLSHYEFFMGYHRQLYRFVEPATVYPFSPGVLERALGPVCVFILRNMRSQKSGWHRDDSASLMADLRTTAPEVRRLPEIFKERADRQPDLRKPLVDVANIVENKLDLWQQIAHNNPHLKYAEYAPAKRPKSPVVLGDFQHRHSGLPVVYENAPGSLRDIEETAGFET